jgi:hypothetical protein
VRLFYFLRAAATVYLIPINDRLVPFARLQRPYFDGDAPPADDHTYVDHWYVLKIPLSPPQHPHNLLIPRRPDTQDSTSSCQKDVAHHGNSSPAKARA